MQITVLNSSLITIFTMAATQYLKRWHKNHLMSEINKEQAVVVEMDKN